ncbi:low affinity sulfate transporter 3-like [Humulus lupulus]|uniref:low affinity sulfate transporter 3-like n=1 Tax=Humulus lupulus TaxID=3486 RepID=UPI002B4095FC|nr:low affinity sulfate transporter 3-like [Humulus lupulus]
MASSAMGDNGGRGNGGGDERAKYLGFSSIAPDPYSPSTGGEADDENEKEKERISFPAGSPKHFKKSTSVTTTTTASVENYNIEMAQVYDNVNDDIEKNGFVERSRWVLNAPEPPGLFREVVDSVRDTIGSLRNKYYKSLQSQSFIKRMVLLHQNIFPILVWGRSYSSAKFKNDLMAGLTIASLCIPQSIGYATLAKLDPQYGLYTSVVPPLIYAVMGTSRDIAIGPVAVVSLLLPSMIQKLVDPGTDPITYRNFVLTATFFSGIFQGAFGFFRLGFLVDFLSHAAIVGFMAGAAIIIGLQQLKGLLGITHFTNKTDIISVSKAVWNSIHHPWSPYNFIIGSSFLGFIFFTRFLGKKNKKLFWLPAAIAPLLSVILSTLIVYLVKADKNGVKIVKHIKGGLNPSSVHLLQLHSPFVWEVAKIGLIVAVVALTEAIAVGRSFATMKGYHLDGNKEMVAMGFMNIIGSLTSCYVATGSFSRTAVNFSAGCETLVSNIVMAITVLISLQFLTKLLYYTPTAILASIILSALPGLINLNAAYHIWKLDKLDFLACIGAFIGVLFASVEIGLTIAVTISFVKIILISIRPGMETLGKLPGTEIFCDIQQYPMAIQIPGTMIIRIKPALLCFANANFVRERIMDWISEDIEENNKRTIQVLILDMSNLLNIDTSGIACLDDMHKSLTTQGIEIAIANPRWQVIHKLKLAEFVSKIEGRVFLTVGEAVMNYATAKIPVRTTA